MVDLTRCEFARALMESRDRERGAWNACRLKIGTISKMAMSHVDSQLCQDHTRLQTQYDEGPFLVEKPAGYQEACDINSFYDPTVQTLAKRLLSNTY